VLLRELDKHKQRRICSLFVLPFLDPASHTGLGAQP